MTKTTSRLVLWLAVAFVAVAAATALILGTAGSRATVLSQSDVLGQLGTADPGGTNVPGSAGSPGESADPAGSPGDPRPAVLGGDTVYETGGGRVTYRCDAAGARLISWSPNPGYRADDVVAGPAKEVSLWFESDGAHDVVVTVTCGPGQKAGLAHWTVIDDHDGSGKDDGSGEQDGSGKKDGFVTPDGVWRYDGDHGSGSGSGKD